MTEKTTESVKLSPWTVPNGAAHCAMRFIEGADPENVANRVAFIEKTPRVRVADFSPTADWKGWKEGPTGSGGCDGHIPENELYGYDPASRAWCDLRLVEMGYILG